MINLLEAGLQFSMLLIHNLVFGHSPVLYKIYDKIEIKPFINGLSDHDAQIICLCKTNITPQLNFQKKKKLD
jgi:hypothetical protein